MVGWFHAQRGGLPALHRHDRRDKDSTIPHQTTTFVFRPQQDSHLSSLVHSIIYFCFSYCAGQLQFSPDVSFIPYRPPTLSYPELSISFVIIPRRPGLSSAHAPLFIPARPHIMDYRRQADDTKISPLRRLMRWLHLKQYQIEVTFSVYMFTPVEKFVFCPSLSAPSFRSHQWH